ncbi:hypothetical protein EIP91_010115 [Steccherinum ochraceum]|uniref:Uncharacterized protein n=1 Tax=Steccherinum ochraceum TaxID=92696 RepID=A0A4R0RYP0_9APHY|nr:hypothetical protein EIP91_010115 [Steccherinum ochraceum]
MGISDDVLRTVHSAYLRITYSRLTLSFFAFSTIYCIVQGIIQSLLINTDLGADNLVAAILQEGEVPHVNVPWHIQRGNETTLKICSEIPGTTWYDSCVTIYDSEVSTALNANWTAPVGYRRADVPYAFHNTLLTKPKGTANAGTTLQAFRNSTGAVTGVVMLTKHGDAFLSEQCTRVLLYPHQILRNSKREEIILLVGQFWFFGISICALIFDSIPHLLALLSMRILETTWSSYTIWRTLDIQHRFQILVVDDSSPCRADLFPHYFHTRLSFQIPDLVLNVTGLVCTSCMAWLLIKMYSIQTFKRVGPPNKVVRIYRVFLTLRVALHLSLFLMTAAMGLWADQLISGPIEAISSRTGLYNALFIFTVVTLAPWCFMGSFAVRRENKIFMAVFLSVCFTYIATWSIMFYSDVYRWTWLQWPFFASMSVASFVVLTCAGVFAIGCLLNFNKGLAHYLHVEGVLAQSDFQPELFASRDLENGGHSASGEIRRKLSTKGSTHSMDIVDISGSPPSRSLSIKKDSNWDFDAAMDRPSIYIVELGAEGDRFKEMPHD